MELKYYRLFNNDLTHLNDNELISQHIHLTKTNCLTNKKDFYNNNPDFDIDYYRLHEDLYKLSEYELIKHYYLFGKNENRIINLNTFLSKYPNLDINFYRLYYDINCLLEYDLIKHYYYYGIKEDRLTNINTFYTKYPDFNYELYAKFNKLPLNLLEINYIQRFLNNNNTIYSINSFIGQYPSFDYNFYRLLYDLTNLTNDEICVSYYLLDNKNKKIKIYSKSDFFKLYPNFDCKLYTEFNSVLKLNSDIECIKHYITHGYKEDRLTCIKTFLDRYPNFDCEFYRILYNLSNLSDTEIYIYHHLVANNQNKIYSKTIFYNLYPDFDCNIYKTFNPHLNFDNDYLYMIHYLNIGHDINMLYLAYDCEFIDLVNKFESQDPILNDKIYNHYFLRKIETYEELCEYHKQYDKQFYICGIKSFYDFYPDFDLNFYKNKYFNYTTKTDIDIMMYYHLHGKQLKHLINNKIKIIIYTGPFDIKCGGILILHNLAYLINNSKYKDKIYAKLFMHNNLRYKNIFCNDFASIDEINENTYVLYPEIITSNPLNCSNVIRWILLALGVEMPLDHYKRWANTDLIYYWENQNVSPPNSKQLICPWLNPIFKNYGTPTKGRDKTCYLVKKGRIVHKNIKWMHDDNSIDIEEMSLNDIVNIFNESKYFYCYDSQTAFIGFSILCGCICVLYPTDGMTKNDFLANSMLVNKVNNINGFSWGNSEIELTNALNSIEQGSNDIIDIYNSYCDSVNSFCNDILII